MVQSKKNPVHQLSVPNERKWLLIDSIPVLRQLSNDNLHRLFPTISKLFPKQVGTIERIPLRINMLHDFDLHRLRRHRRATVPRWLDADRDGTLLLLL